MTRGCTSAGSEPNCSQVMCLALKEAGSTALAAGAAARESAVTRKRREKQAAMGVPPGPPFYPKEEREHDAPEGCSRDRLPGSV
jgi:hypothetical protein